MADVSGAWWGRGPKIPYNWTSRAPSGREFVYGMNKQSLRNRSPWWTGQAARHEREIGRIDLRSQGIYLKGRGAGVAPQGILSPPTGSSYKDISPASVRARLKKSRSGGYRGMQDIFGTPLHMATGYGMASMMGAGPVLSSATGIGAAVGLGGWLQAPGKDQWLPRIRKGGIGGFNRGFLGAGIGLMAGTGPLPSAAIGLTAAAPYATIGGGLGAAAGALAGSYFDIPGGPLTGGVVGGLAGWGLAHAEAGGLIGKATLGVGKAAGIGIGRGIGALAKRAPFLTGGLAVGAGVGLYQAATGEDWRTAAAYGTVAAAPIALGLGGGRLVGSILGKGRVLSAATKPIQRGIFAEIAKTVGVKMAGSPGLSIFGVLMGAHALSAVGSMISSGVAEEMQDEYGTFTPQGIGMGPNYMNAGNMTLASHYASQ